MQTFFVRELPLRGMIIVSERMKRRQQLFLCLSVLSFMGFWRNWKKSARGNSALMKNMI